LQHFVSRIMISRFQSDSNKPRPTTPFPPQAEHCLYFYPYNRTVCRNYADNSINSTPHSILVGPQLSRVDLTMGYDMLVILVGFQPGGMHRLLRIPMNELLDMPIDSSLLLGREIEEVTEQLNAAPDVDKMLEIVEQYLLKKVNGLEKNASGRRSAYSNVTAKNPGECGSTCQTGLRRRPPVGTAIPGKNGNAPKLFIRLVRFLQAWVMREKIRIFPG
jgi:hypothetical protein